MSMVQHKKKILFILYSLGGGGIEQSMVHVLTSPAMKTFAVELLLIKPIDDYSSIKILKKHSITLYSLTNTTGKIHPVILPLVICMILGKLCFRMVQHDYKLIVGAGEYAPYTLSLIASLIRGIPYILVVANNLEAMNAEKPQFLQPIYWHMLSIPLKRARRVICFSKGLKKSVEALFKIPGSAIEVIYHVPESPNTTTIRKKKTKQDPFTILSVGRLEKQKGHIYLIRAFYEFAQQYPQSQLIICGKGSQHNYLMKTIQHYGLLKKVTLTGFQRDIQKQLQSADVFVFPSLYEGFGIALYEALQAGVPVIATDCAYGPREIITHLPVHYPHIPIQEPVAHEGNMLLPVFTQLPDFKSSLSPTEKMLVDAIGAIYRNRFTPHRSIGSRKAREKFRDSMSKQYFTCLNNVLSL